MTPNMYISWIHTTRGSDEARWSTCWPQCFPSEQHGYVQGEYQWCPHPQGERWFHELHMLHILYIPVSP